MGRHEAGRLCQKRKMKANDACGLGKLVSRSKENILVAYHRKEGVTLPVIHPYMYDENNRKAIVTTIDGWLSGLWVYCCHFVGRAI
jgi:hypothetical protein